MTVIPTLEQTLPGREVMMAVSECHYVNGNPLLPPFPQDLQRILFGMGCYWGVERKLWKIEGVYSTAVGFTAGLTPNPTYKEVCTGMTGHNEVVQVIYDTERISLQALLNYFWENHDPTQGMRQGNDVGTQYRSGLYLYDPESIRVAEQSKACYQRALNRAGYKQITTEILEGAVFYYAEDEHQQYLAKHPDGYCNLQGIGVAYPE